jgi:hypothetical protein
MQVRKDGHKNMQCKQEELIQMGDRFEISISSTML